jgi:hypothetical protein
VSDERVVFALSLFASNGLCERLEAQCSSPLGRRRSLPVRALFVALLLLAVEDSPLHLLGVTELLWRRISKESRASLGVAGSAATRRELLARYRCVRYLFHAILKRCDPSGLKKNRRLSRADLDRASTTLSPEEITTRRAALESLVDELVGASLSLVTQSEWAAFSGAIGLDATPVPLWSRGPSRRSGLEASDPDGGWYVRHGDHRGEEDHSGRVAGKVSWALEETIATMAPPPGDPAAHPNLILGLVLGRPGIDPGGTGARLLAALAERGPARGHRTGLVGADRAYSSALPSSFHLPARALGYELVFDYRKDELGIQAEHNGAILVEGTWCCPGMPKALIAATKEHRAGKIDDDLYDKRIAARSEYRLKKKDGPDADGYERLSCPASGPAPRLSCPLRPGSELPRDGRTPVLLPPDEPPKCCRQTSVTIAPDVGAKHRQHLAYASEPWRRAYATCRNSIEGKNGFLKDTAHEALACPARRRVRGIAAQSTLVAFLAMAANIRALRSHRELVADGGRERAAARARRRRTSLEDFRPAT